MILQAPTHSARTTPGTTTPLDSQGGSGFYRSRLTGLRRPGRLAWAFTLPASCRPCRCPLSAACLVLPRVLRL
eukprot:1734696-Lingulodinium_polyedra.AAC.1